MLKYIYLNFYCSGLFLKATFHNLEEPVGQVDFPESFSKYQILNYL
jgi:hypothetical protein